jgi:hypothetical protein
MDIKDDIYMIIFVLHGVEDNNGKMITDMITSLKKPEYMTENEGIVIYLINLKTTQIERIEPTDSDQLKYLHPKEIISKKLKYSSGLTYSELIRRAAYNFSFSTCLTLEEEIIYNIKTAKEECVMENWKGKIKIGRESTDEDTTARSRNSNEDQWNCSIYQFKDGGDEIGQRQVILIKDKHNLSKVDIDKILKQHMNQEKHYVQKENMNITYKTGQGIHYLFEKGIPIELKNGVGTIQRYASGFRNNIRSIGVYDDQHIFLFSDHQLFGSDFHLDLINIKDGKQIEYGFELLFSGEEERNDYWELTREIQYALSYSNRTCIFTTTKYQKEETLDMLQNINETGSVDV